MATLAPFIPTLENNNESVAPVYSRPFPYTFGNAREAHLQNPKGFEIPKTKECLDLKVGHMVKLTFENDDGHSERMWVKIASKTPIEPKVNQTQGNKPQGNQTQGKPQGKLTLRSILLTPKMNYTGRLSNTPVILTKIRAGITVHFNDTHICDIDTSSNPGSISLDEDYGSGFADETNFSVPSDDPEIGNNTCPCCNTYNGSEKDHFHVKPPPKKCCAKILNSNNSDDYNSKIENSGTPNSRNCENDGIYICTGCLYNYYCSPVCQRQDWPSHRNECKQKLKKALIYKKKLDMVQREEGFILFQDGNPGNTSAKNLRPVPFEFWLANTTNKIDWELYFEDDEIDVIKQHVKLMRKVYLK